MSVSAANIGVYGAANMPEDDTSTVGGGIDLAVKIVFTDLAANDTLDFVSSSAADTDQVYRAYGFDAVGGRDQEDFDITGTSLVTGGVTLERVNRIVKLSGSALVGTITVTEHSGGTTVATLEHAAGAGAGAEITEVRKPFYAMASDPDAAKIVYEKIFFRNNHATDTLPDAYAAVMDAPVYSTPTATTVDQNSASNAKVLYMASTTDFTSGLSIVIGSGTARQEAAKIDTVSAGVSVTLIDNLKYTHTAVQADAVAKSRLLIDVESTLDGSDTSTDRVTAPTGYGYVFDCSDHNVANLRNLTAGAAQGAWMSTGLDAAGSPFKDTIALRLAGNVALP